MKGIFRENVIFILSNVSLIILRAKTLKIYRSKKVGSLELKPGFG